MGDGIVDDKVDHIEIVYVNTPLHALKVTDERALFSIVNSAEMLVGIGLADLWFGYGVVPLLVALAITVVVAALRIRQLKEAGLLEAFPVSIVMDAEGITYGSPADTVVVPWEKWRKAYRRYGVWHVKLAAQPLWGVAFPVGALNAEEAAGMRQFLLDHGLRVKYRRLK
jgi:hypothetical protein